MEISSAGQLQVRNNRTAWVVDFVNPRQEINMRASGSGEDKITGSLRKAAVRDERINSVLDLPLVLNTPFGRLFPLTVLLHSLLRLTPTTNEVRLQ